VYRIWANRINYNEWFDLIGQVRRTQRMRFAWFEVFCLGPMSFRHSCVPGQRQCLSDIHGFTAAQLEFRISICGCPFRSSSTQRTRTLRLTSSSTDGVRRAHTFYGIGYRPAVPSHILCALCFVLLLQLSCLSCTSILRPLENFQQLCDWTACVVERLEWDLNINVFQRVQICKV
jgi:hypothetical protein